MSPSVSDSAMRHLSLLYHGTHSIIALRGQNGASVNIKCNARSRYIMRDTPHPLPQHTTTLDVRPDLERGDEPFERIMAAAAAIGPGQHLAVIAPFEPVPLYAVLQGQGFSHQTAQPSPDEWVVTFTRSE
jgi:uncharacterized protein (DUF2249 family)